MRTKRMISSIVEIVIGVALVACSYAGLVDEFWSGMGAALLVVGILQMARLIRYNSNEEYREKIDVNNSDERNRYIAAKAWSYAGYVHVFIAAIGTIVFRILEQEALSMLCSFSVCVIIVIYWISYGILQKRY